MNGKLYQVGERDIIEQGNHYSKHVCAMTNESLYSKSDIAAELAHRDIKIEKLTNFLKQCASFADSQDAFDSCALNGIAINAKALLDEMGEE